MKTIKYRVHGYWLGPLVTEWVEATQEEFEAYCKEQNFIKNIEGVYVSGKSRLEIEEIDLNRKKAYLYGTKHGMPAVTLIDEDGYVVGSHGGSSIEDAEGWFNHYNRGKGYEVIRVDQKVVERHIYGGEPLDILPEGLIKAFKLNQQHKGIKA